MIMQRYYAFMTSKPQDLTRKFNRRLFIQFCFAFIKLHLAPGHGDDDSSKLAINSKDIKIVNF